MTDLETFLEGKLWHSHMFNGKGARPGCIPDQLIHTSTLLALSASSGLSIGIGIPSYLRPLHLSTSLPMAA